MINKKFYKKVEEIRRDLYNGSIDNIKKKGIFWSYIMISSNLATFLPQLNVEKHVDIIRNMQFHRSLSGIELLYSSLLKKTRVNDPFNIIEQSYNKAHLFVGYHAGPYNLFLRFLAQKNIPFCVVANKEYLEKYEKIVQKLFNEIPQRKMKKLEFFLSEDPKLLFKLTKKMKQGFSVMIYVDGNSGTKKNNFSEDKNLLKINFLNHHIYGRKGVAYLAYLSKSPIVTVMSKRDKNFNNEISLNLIETNDLIHKYKRSDFIRIITQKLYRELEKYLEKYFEQWSGWFYIHNFFDVEELNEKKEKRSKMIDFKVNKFSLNNLIHLIKYDDDNIYLVKNKNYEIMKIEKLLYDVLMLFNKPRKIVPNESLIIDDYDVSWSFIKELVDMNYLIAI